MAIMDNKGHSGQGAEGSLPAHQHPAATDAKDTGQYEKQEEKAMKEEQEREKKDNEGNKSRNTGLDNTSASDGRPGSTVKNSSGAGTDTSGKVGTENKK